MGQFKLIQNDMDNLQRMIERREEICYILIEANHKEFRKLEEELENLEAEIERLESELE
jgi:hypothetical protein